MGVEIERKFRVRAGWRPDGHTWEVDIFHGENEGLVVAEIELGAEDEPFARPDWLADEVTGDARYYNSSLARTPYRLWEER